MGFEENRRITREIVREIVIGETDVTIELYSHPSVYPVVGKGRQDPTGLLTFSHVTLRGQKPLLKGYPPTLETIGDRVRKRRLELGLTRREAAERIGVHFTTITEWELRGRTPAARFVEVVVGFLGYVPSWP